MRIGFSICDPGLTFGAIVGLGAKERAAELGVDLSVVSVSSPLQQAETIKRFVAERVDAMIVEAVESQIVLPAIREADAVGIPIVIADMGIEHAPAACIVRSDNVAGGELAGAYLADRLQGRGKVAHLQGLLTADNGVDRTRGMHNVLDRHPDVEIVFQGTSEWTREAGAEVMREVLAEHPSVDAVFGGNDPLALGAVDAIAEAGRTGEIIVAGFDALPDALLEIERGRMDATVRQAPRSIGELSLQTAVRIVRGDPVEPIVQTAVALVTADGIAEASLATLPLFPRVLRDLTESTVALAEERSLLRAVIDNLPDLIYVKDQASRFMLVNPAGLRHLGASSEREVIGKTDFDFFPRDLAAQYLADEQRVLESGEPLVAHEERSVDAAGNTRWFLTTKVLARDANGNVVGLVGMNRDVTERKQLEEQLRHVQKLETVGQLAGGIAHDFNNLLTAIDGYAALLLAAVPSGSEMHGDALEIQKAAARGATLAHQLLAFARRQVLEPCVLDLNELIDNVDKLLRRLIGEQIELVVMHDDDRLYARVDAGQIEQVLVNLAVNARDAMPAGGTLTIRASRLDLQRSLDTPATTVEAGEYVRVSVRDTGVGMAPEVAARAFEPFFTTKDVGKGTGLGLATSSGVIEQHGGHIWLQSEPGVGTAVTFCLPRIGEPQISRPDRSPAEEVAGGAETVLVVEDEASVRRLAVRVLRDQGYTVLEAGHGEEALAVATRSPEAIDLLVSDVVMPRMDGATLSERVRALHPDVKVLYLSGYTRSAIDRRGWLEDGVALLQKPFSPSDLVRHVRQELSNRAA